MQMQFGNDIKMFNSSLPPPQHRSKMGEKRKATEELEECLFFDSLYSGSEQIIEETDELVAFKLLEIEREIDNLPNMVKEAYFIALQQEIKQQIQYVRNPKFLLLFLRAEKFDSRKAALRLVSCLKFKLELFGPEMLPLRVRQYHLNEDDLKVLSAGFLHYDGTDCGGRLVVLIQRYRLQLHGLINEGFMKNISRVTFYQMMSSIEDDEEAQKRGISAIVWNLNCRMPLKSYRILFHALIKMVFRAIPVRHVALHHCSNNAMERMCVNWVHAIKRNFSQDQSRFHGPSAADCLSGLSMYGINVNSLPLSTSGDFEEGVYRKRLEHIKQRELSAVSGESCNNESSSGSPLTPVELLKEDLEEIKLNTAPLVEMPCNQDIQEQSKKLIADDVSVEGQQNIMATCSDNRNQSKDDNKNKVVAVDTSFSPSKPTAVESGFEQFALKLVEILDCTTNHDAIWWSREGSAFVIEKKKFATNVLPIYFKGVKMNSFLRRLRRWKFQRLPRSKDGGDKASSGPNCTEFQHQLFQKNSPQMLKDHNKVETNLSVREKFPRKLMKAIDNNNASSTAIWWICDGKAFAIDTHRLSSEVLDKNFEGIQLSSFLRMLRKWGFQRLPEQEESTGNVLVFYHDLFQIDSPLQSVLLENWTYSNDSNYSSSDDNNDHHHNKSRQRPRGESFVKKLHRILDNPRFHNAIWWLKDSDVDNNNAFAIQIATFCHNVLPEEYKGLNFKCFQRNLTRWGFKNVKNEISTPNVLVFQNPTFRKESFQPFL